MKKLIAIFVCLAVGQASASTRLGLCRDLACTQRLVIPKGTQPMYHDLAGRQPSSGYVTPQYERDDHTSMYESGFY